MVDMKRSGEGKGKKTRGRTNRTERKRANIITRNSPSSSKSNAVFFRAFIQEARHIFASEACCPIHNEIVCLRHWGWVAYIGFRSHQSLYSLDYRTNPPDITFWRLKNWPFILHRNLIYGPVATSEVSACRWVPPYSPRRKMRNKCFCCHYHNQASMLCIQAIPL